MKVFGSKKYKILDSKHTEGLSFEKTDKTKFIIDVDIMQGSVLKVTIPAGGVIVSRNQDYTIHKESNTKTELYIGIDEGLDSIEFPEGAEVYMQVTSSGGSDNGSGGGSAEIPTCTVRIKSGENVSYGGIHSYTKYENGKIELVTVDPDGLSGNVQNEFDFILENVVCGSIVFLRWEYLADLIQISITGDAIQVYDGFLLQESPLFRAPMDAGAECVIEISCMVDDIPGPPEW